MSYLFRLKFFINSFFRGYIDELKQLISFSISSPPSTPEKKYLIFSGGRTGSTLLLNLLNENPNVYCDGEVLKGRMLSPLNFVKRQEKISNAKIYGFKLLTYQLKNIQSNIEDKKKFLKDLQKKGYKIIYLERENKIYQSLSVSYAMRQDQWHLSKKTNKQQTKITLEVNEFAQALTDIEDYSNYEKELLKGLPHLYLSYEQHLQNSSNHPETIRLIANFLDIDLAFREQKLRKILPKKLSNIIVNAPEILNYIKNVSNYQAVEI